MIRVLHGEDEFTITEALARIRASVGPEEVRDANTTVFEGRGFHIDAVVAAANGVPFLAERRLVIVRGLLSRLEEGDKKPSRPPVTDPLPLGEGGYPPKVGAEGEAPSPPKRSEVVSKSLGDEWDGLASRLEGIPATTELVFFDVPENKDQKLKRNGRALRAVGPRAEVREFEPPRRQALDAWTRDRFAALGAQAEPDAVTRLGWLTNGNLRMLDQEIRKLALHANGRPVRREDVNLLVPEAREENIFAAVDAILERRPGVAMKLLYSLLAGGATAGELLNLLARQVRLVILARELSDQSVPPEEIGTRIGLKAGFPLDKTLRQAARFSPAYLAATLRRLLDADLSIKTGELDERLAIEILIARLSAV